MSKKITFYCISCGQDIIRVRPSGKDKAVMVHCEKCDLPYAIQAKTDKKVFNLSLDNDALTASSGIQLCCPKCSKKLKRSAHNIFELYDYKCGSCDVEYLLDT